MVFALQMDAFDPEMEEDDVDEGLPGSSSSALVYDDDEVMLSSFRTPHEYHPQPLGNGYADTNVYLNVPRQAIFPSGQVYQVRYYEGDSHQGGVGYMQHVDQQRVEQGEEAFVHNEHSYASPERPRMVVERPPAPRLHDPTQPDRPRLPKIPKVKRPAAERIVETDAATAAAIKRISTTDGWKSMNTWLKAAENEPAKLKKLLSQCYQAKVTVGLLKANDTAKFLRKLIKEHSDPEVRSLAERTVNRWKKAVASADPSEEIEKKKGKEEKNEEEEEIEEDPSTMPKERRRSLEEEAKKSSTTVTPSSPTVATAPTEKKHRAKARVYTSRGRSTGLEGDDPASSSTKKEEKKRKDNSPPDAPAPKKTTNEKGNAAGAPGAPSGTPKKAAVPAKKVTLSTGFMDALFSPVEAPKKKPIPRRRPVEPTTSKPQPVPAHDRPVLDRLLSPTEGTAKGIVMEGLFSDTSSRTVEKSPSPMDKKEPVLYESEEPAVLPGRRRIRFADEEGKELVETRLFEIEEGERINVNRLSPEEMKHHEMMMEKQWRAEASGHELTEEEDRSTSVVGVQWRFVPVTGYDPLPIEYGSASQMKVIQAERQQHALRAFFSPDIPTEHFDEPDPEYDANIDPALLRDPISIPLESVTEEPEVTPKDVDSSVPDVGVTVAPPSSVLNTTTAIVEVAKPAEPSTTASPLLTDKLKNLLAGLKASGLVADPNAPVPTVPTVIPTTSATVPTYFQEPGPIAGYNMPPPKVHQIQQDFPGPMMGGPPVGVMGGMMMPGGPPQMMGMPPAGMMAPPAMPGGGIQVVNLDVHAPTVHDAGSAPPMGSMGPRPFPSSRPCSFFNSPRGCRFGDRCGFAHVKVDAMNQGSFRGRGGFIRGGPMGGGDFRGGRGGAFRGRAGFGGGGMNGADARGTGTAAAPMPVNNQTANDSTTVTATSGRTGRDVDMRRAEKWEGREKERRDGGGGGGYKDYKEGRESRRRRSRSRSRSPRDSPRDSTRSRHHRSSSSRHHSDPSTTSQSSSASDVDLRARDTDARPPRTDLNSSNDDIDGVPMDRPSAAV